MKRITVRYFAAFRDMTGMTAENVETGVESLDELFEELCERHSGLIPQSAALVALNDVMTDWTADFADGDEVLLFPPVAGG